MSAIDDQNAKQIRDAMDVVIQLDATATSYGDVITITNENLIRATVSLRSDLSIIEPTLPESEINVEAYWPEDVAEAVASIPDDTPITYSAGYPGDMSPERKFYVSGQVTWADNVLTIHGVDAVHFLDVPREMIGIKGWGYYNYQDTTLDHVVTSIRGMLLESGIMPQYSKRVSFYTGDATDGTKAMSAFSRGRTYRDIIAQCMGLMHIDNIPANYFSGSQKGSFWLTYVDAGMPTLIADTKPSSKWSLSEADCGDVQKTVEPVISSITVNNVRTAAGGVTEVERDPMGSTIEVGTIDWIKGQGAFVSLDEGAYRIAYGLSRADGVTPVISDDYVLPILPTSADGSPSSIAPNVAGEFFGQSYRFQYGILFTNETQQKYYEDSGTTIFAQVVPWDCVYSSNSKFKWRSQAAAWAGLVAQGIIPSDAETVQLKVFGNIVIQAENQTIYETGRSGVNFEIQNGWIGRIGFSDSQYLPQGDALPDYGYRSLFDKSNITGSFRWKGDPRQQPRDVATFVLRDGTEETITLENITIQHEKGGTYADYTYRKGIV